VSHIALLLFARHRALTIVDDDVVEPSNLNRQRFYSKDVGQNKSYSLAENLLPECVHAHSHRLSRLA